LKHSPITPICIPGTDVKHVAFLASNGTNALVFIPNLYMLSINNNIHTVINFSPSFIITVVLSLIKFKSQHLHSKCDATVDEVEYEKATWLNIGISSKLVVNIAFDLEDKITFRGVGNDMINVVVIPCLFTNMFYNEEIIYDIKVVELEMMERIRQMLLSSWSDALEFYHVQIMDPLEVDSEVRKHVAGVTCHDISKIIVMCEVRLWGLIDPTINLGKILAVIDEKPLIMCHNFKSSYILSKDHFYVIIARLGGLFCCVVTSDLQWYMTNQSLHFSKTNNYDRCVVLLNGIPGSNYLASVTLGMCKRAVRQLEQSVVPLPLCYSISEWMDIYLEPFGGKSASAVTLLLSI
ncbi:hypothetical protein A2U01_0015750, partial [Trifolium medium]|nr:hypothetical protein [Trifolium medium]